MTQFKDTAMDCDCQECGRTCTITNFGDNSSELEYCPFCGLDGYGAASSYHFEQTKLEMT